MRGMNDGHNSAGSKLKGKVLNNEEKENISRGRPQGLVPHAAAAALWWQEKHPRALAEGIH